MHFMRFFWLSFLLAGVVLLAACQPTAAPAEKTVESYLAALVNESSEEISTLTCKHWEEEALTELDSFIGVKASLVDVSCQNAGTEGAQTLVTCSGKISATYNNEVQELDVAGRTYQVVQESGEWRVCGYR